MMGAGHDELFTAELMLYGGLAVGILYDIFRIARRHRAIPTLE